MPRTPRNPGSGKAPYNGPARGAGWGGPANGKPARAPKAAAFDHDPPNRSGVNVVPAEKIERVTIYRQRLWDIMESDGEPTANKIAVIDRLWDRDEGKPLAKQEQTGETIIRVMTGVPRANRP